MKIKADWWLVNSLFLIITGVVGMLSRLVSGNAVGVLIIGGINILIGVALLQRSKIIFLIVFILSGVSLLSELSRLVSVSKQTGNFTPSVSTVLIVIGFACAVMLWQQIKKEKANAK